MSLDIEGVIEKLIVSEERLSELVGQLYIAKESLADITGKLELKCIENAHMQQELQNLKQQVSAKGAELINERKERVAGKERVSALEVSVTHLRHELLSYAAVLKRVQKSRDDHAQSRYGLAQKINELKTELELKNESLQIEHNRSGSLSAQLKILKGELTGLQLERDAQANEKVEAQEEAELISLQLHQLQEELVKVSLSCQGKQTQLQELSQHVSATGAQLEKERKESVVREELLSSLEIELSDLKSERDARAKENLVAQNALKELSQQVSGTGAELEKERKERFAREELLKSLEIELGDLKGERDALVRKNAEACKEAELTLLKLHKVQEEMESYFLEARTQDELLRQQQSQSLAMRQAISDLICQASTASPNHLVS